MGPSNLGYQTTDHKHTHTHHLEDKEHGDEEVGQACHSDNGTNREGNGGSCYGGQREYQHKDEELGSIHLEPYDSGTAITAQIVRHSL